MTFALLIAWDPHPLGHMWTSSSPRSIIFPNKISFSKHSHLLLQLSFPFLTTFMSSSSFLSLHAAEQCGINPILWTCARIFNPPTSGFFLHYTTATALSNITEIFLWFSWRDPLVLIFSPVLFSVLTTIYFSSPGVTEMLVPPHFLLSPWMLSSIFLTNSFSPINAIVAIPSTLSWFYFWHFINYCQIISHPRFQEFSKCWWCPNLSPEPWHVTDCHRRSPRGT